MSNGDEFRGHIHLFEVFSYFLTIDQVHYKDYIGLVIFEKTLGPNHPDVAQSLEYLAKLYRATRRIREAKRLERRAAKIRAIRK